MGLSGGLAQHPDHSPEHARAVVAAYALLEIAQTGPVGPAVAAPRAEAEANGWHDVACLLHYADYAYHQLVDGDVEPAFAGMERAAELSGDDSLVGLVVATRGELPQQVRYGHAADGDLARAIALLDDGRGSAVHRTVGYVACALGFNSHGLWELEEEMYARAAEALAVPLGSPLDESKIFNRRVITYNQVESHAAWACGLADAGLHDEARVRAATRYRLTPADVAILPPQWTKDAVAVDYLLAALAREPEPAPLDRVVADVLASTWSGYAGCARLGAAIRALDQDDPGSAAPHAEAAVELLGEGHLPSLRMLALSVAARIGATPASVRYVEELNRLRWTTRLQILGAARARIEAERMRIDNERLTERAYLDELTGVANRHAYARHLARLRHGDGTHGLAVLMVDVDHFKQVNDRFGHHVGDDVLRRVASLLTERSRPSDLVARLGGDEFVLLLEAVHRVDARRRGEELVGAVLDATWDDVAPGLHVTVSAGLSCGSAPRVDDLLGEADRMLYEAKARGRARLVAARDVPPQLVTADPPARR